MQRSTAAAAPKHPRYHAAQARHPVRRHQRFARMNDDPYRFSFETQDTKGEGRVTSKNATHEDLEFLYGVSMIVSAPPAAAFRQLVRYYYQADGRFTTRSVVQPVPARSPQAIEFTFGTPYEVHRLDRAIVENAHPIALIGAQTFRRVDLVMRGTVDAFTIVFQPGGLFRLFAIPGEVLTNDHFEAQSALGRRVHDLHQQLGSVTSFDEGVRVANDYLCLMRPSFGSIDPVAKAAASVLSRGGQVRVSELARSIGIGVRQFERRFRYEMGITPKLYARVARFESALRLKALAPDTRWTEIAHALGYHDQMHMVHDFNQLSGDNPTAIGDQLDMFVQPEVRMTNPSAAGATDSAPSDRAAPASPLDRRKFSFRKVLK